MKKAVIAASACFVAGLIGCTISLPMVAKDVIHLYNDTVSETANFYTTQDLPSGITELRMVNQDTMGMSLVEVRQSPDDQIHLQVYRSEFSGFDGFLLVCGGHHGCRATLADVEFYRTGFYTEAVSDKVFEIFTTACQHFVSKGISAYGIVVFTDKCALVVMDSF